MNKLEALLSHDQNTSSTIASFESDNLSLLPSINKDMSMNTNNNTPTTITPSSSSSLLTTPSTISRSSSLPPSIPPETSSTSSSSTTDDSLQVNLTSPRARTLSAMSMDQMREKVSTLSMRRRRLQKVQSTSALPPVGMTTSDVSGTSIPIPTLSIPTNNIVVSPSSSKTVSPPLSPQSSPEKEVSNVTSPPVISNSANSLFANLSPLASNSRIGSFLSEAPIVSSSPTKTEETTPQWDDSKYTLVVSGVVYVRMDYVKRQVEDIMNKYSNTRREFKERERMMKKHFEKMDQEKTEKLEFCMKEFEEKCASVQIKCREAFLKKYNEKVDELNEKIKELMDEKEDLKNRLERESKKVYSDMQNLVSNVESKMKQNTMDFKVKQEELNKTIRIQKKLFFGLLNHVRKDMSIVKKDIDSQTEELVQDLELEQYRKQVEELKNILDMEQFEFQKVYVEKESRLITELTESKNQLIQLESCMREQTNAIKELENQLSELNVESDPNKLLQVSSLQQEDLTNLEENLENCLKA